MPKSDWNEYKRLILRKMDDDQVKWEKMFTLVSGLREDVNGLKSQSSLARWVIGGVAGMVGTGVITAIFTFFK